MSAYNEIFYTETFVKKSSTREKLWGGGRTLSDIYEGKFGIVLFEKSVDKVHRRNWVSKLYQCNKLKAIFSPGLHLSIQRKN